MDGGICVGYGILEFEKVVFNENFIVSFVWIVVKGYVIVREC